MVDVLLTYGLLGFRAVLWRVPLRCCLQESLRIHKAEEKGRVAYKVGGELGQTERVSAAGALSERGAAAKAVTAQQPQHGAAVHGVLARTAAGGAGSTSPAAAGAAAAGTASASAALQLQLLLTLAACVLLPAAIGSSMFCSVWVRRSHHIQPMCTAQQ